MIAISSRNNSLSSYLVLPNNGLGMNYRGKNFPVLKCLCIQVSNRSTVSQREGYLAIFTRIIAQISKKKKKKKFSSGDMQIQISFQHFKLERTTHHAFESLPIFSRPSVSVPGIDIQSHNTTLWSLPRKLPQQLQ